MAEITASLVKELRDKTGAGMMDCKKALSESGGDIEAAVDWLRKSGLAAAAKKSGRIAAEGLVALATSGVKGAAVEVNSETDFVSRNETFQDFVAKTAEIALTTDENSGQLAAASYPGTDGTVAEKLTEMVASIGENMTLRRSAVLGVEEGIVASYMHKALKPGLGHIGVLVALQSPADESQLESLGKQLAMHIAATNPQAVSRESVNPADLERERAILVEQARESGKPENIIDKMVEGRLRKFYEESCLLEQTFVIDGESKVGTIVEAAAKDFGQPVEIKGFVRFALGEGIDKKEEDFAAEVASVAQT